MENNIRQHREKKGWSQRRLAEAVGTSQQQVQRIEKGITHAKIDLVFRICEALDTRIEKIFPTAHEVLEASMRQGQSFEQALTDPHVSDQLAQAGVDADPVIWTLKLRFQSGLEKYYRLSGPDSQRFGAVMSNLEWNAQSERETVQFFCFDSGDLDVAVNMEKVALAHVLFDPPNIEGHLNQDEEDYELRVWLTDSSEPVVFAVNQDEPETEDLNSGEIGMMLTHLDGAAERGSFISFEDEDGERVYLSVKDIAVLEVPAGVTNPEPEYPDGEEELEPEGEDFAVDNSGVADLDLQTSEEGRFLVDEKRPEALELTRCRSITVSCCKCGISVRDIEKARGEIREDLHEKGWSVAVPIWTIQVPAVKKEQFYAEHPDLKRKTVDICPICIRKGMRKTTNRMQNSLLQ